MLNFYRISSVDDLFFNELYRLYTSSFPVAERRNWAGLEREITSKKQFSTNAVIQNGEFIGLFNYWMFDSFYYIEHFAINPLLRRQNIGSNVIEAFKSRVSRPIVLEVEMPHSPESTRRIRFYEKLGFMVISKYYAQPPYGHDGFLMPMLIMCNDYHFANSNFKFIKETLYKNVYNLDERENSN